MDEEALRRWRQAVERARKAIEDGEDDPEVLRALGEKLGGVQGALEKLSSSSISRVTLSDAVRESLKKLVEEDDGQLFGDLEQLRAEVERVRSEAREIREIRGELTDLSDDLRREAAGNAGLADSVRDLDQRLDDLSGSVRAATGANRPDAGPGERVETRVRAAIESLIVGFRHATARIEKEIAGELSELRAEHRAAHGELSERLNRIEEGIEEQGDGLQRRLARFEEALAAVEERLEARIDERLAQLQASASREPAEYADSAGPAEPDAARRALDAHLLAVRDALRACLEENRGWRVKPGFWERLSGRRPRDTRLRAAEWEEHRRALEAALAALEAVIPIDGRNGSNGSSVPSIRSRAASDGRPSRNSAST